MLMARLSNTIQLKMRKHMIINRVYNIIGLSISLTILLSCNRGSVESDKHIATVLSGDYAKLWLWRGEDPMDCNCYYELIFKSGKMRHFRRDRHSGVFVDYFNNLSGDVLNDDDYWHYQNGTLRLKGVDYRVKRVSEGYDTIVIERFYQGKIYFLIDSKLMNEPK